MIATPTTATLVGYARCSTDRQDLGIDEHRIYTDRGLTGTTRARPGLDQTLAAVRQGDTLVVPNSTAWPGPSRIGFPRQPSPICFEYEA